MNQQLLKTLKTSLPALCAAILLTACGGGGGDSAAPVPAPAAGVPTLPPAPPPAGALAPQVTLAWSYGTGVGNVVITLNPTAAPATVANFLNYVNSGFYSCTVIHRYARGFVAQGGGYAGPLSVEWEDSGMDREFGAAEASAFVRKMDFAPSNRAFDAAFEK